MEYLIVGNFGYKSFIKQFLVIPFTEMNCLFLILFFAGLIFVSKANGNSKGELAKFEALKFVEKAIKLSLISQKIKNNLDEAFKKEDKNIAESSNQNSLNRNENIYYLIKFENFKKGPPSDEFSNLKNLMDIKKLEEMFLGELETLEFKNWEKDQLKEMIETIWKKILENMIGNESNEKNANQIKIKPRDSKDLVHLQILIFYAAYYKNLIDFLARNEIRSKNSIKKSFKKVKSLEKNIKVLTSKLAAKPKNENKCNDCQTEYEDIKNELEEKQKLLAEINYVKENSLESMIKWMELALKGLKEEIGKISHVENKWDIFMKLFDFLIWENIVPHGGKTIAAGQKLGKFELKLPSADAEQ